MTDHERQLAEAERQLRASLHARFYELSSARKQEAADYKRVA